MTPELEKLTGRMPCVCMYCHDTYGHKPCLPALDGKPSHGICHARECRARYAADMGGAEVRSGISVDRISRICGLDAASITLRCPGEWVKGGAAWADWRLPARGAAQIDFIATAQLPELVGIFATSGAPAAAAKLMRFLAGGRSQPAPAVVAVPALSASPTHHDATPWYQKGQFE